MNSTIYIPANYNWNKAYSTLPHTHTINNGNAKLKNNKSIQFNVDVQSKLL